MNLFWIGDRNFGDALNPLLYSAMTGKDVTRHTSSPKVLAIGSVLSKANPGDTIWGTGAISAHTDLSLTPDTTILALRGPLSAALVNAIGIPTPKTYGDPALLLPNFIKANEKTATIGYSPHHRDYSTDIQLPKGTVKIDTWGDTRSVLEQVTSCKLIVSSSLHGIVVAEAYGIPAVWVEVSDRVAGRGFKFYDYYLGTRRLPKAPLDWRNGSNWSQVPPLARSWQPPRFDKKALLASCPWSEVGA